MQNASGSFDYCVKDGNQIILSGGAMLSPQLLRWSGIGDAEILTNISAQGLVTVP